VTRTRVKVCCIASDEELGVAVAAGADAVGLVGPMPSGPGPIPLETAARLARRVPPGVDSFLLTSRTTIEALIAEIDTVQPSVVQLVDRVEASAYPALRERFPALRIVQVVHVEDETAVALATTLQDRVDGFLLDSGRPSLAVKELGGTGRVHDWAVSARLVRAVRRPVYLAGGLKPGNVGEAIAAVRPFGVDLCSGVRQDGALHAPTLESFLRAVAAA
jgi:phosphoribosylanthranilate isomerase